MACDNIGIKVYLIFLTTILILMACLFISINIDEYDSEVEPEINVYGMSFKKDGTEKSVVLSGIHKQFFTLNIPSSITVEDETFAVIGIHQKALKGSNVPRVVIPSSVTFIGKESFKGCHDLAELVLAEGLLKIESGAFEDCTSLKSLVIPDSVKSLGKSAFKNCSGLTELTIPISLDASVDKKKPAFKGCLNVSSFVFTPGSGSACNYEYDSFVPWCKSREPSVSVVIENNVTSVGKRMFMNGANITDLELPETLETIGSEAFYCCSGLKSLSFCESLKEIDNEAFVSCKSLTSLTMKDNVVRIGTFAFSCCYSLKKIVISNKIEYIGMGAFESCRSLTDLTIPVDVNATGFLTQPLFSGCKSLDTLTLTPGKTGMGYDYSRYFWSKAKFDLSPWHGDWYSLKNLTICEGVKKIGSFTFKNCCGLEHVTLPSTLKEVSERAFEKCRSLKEIILPDGFERLGTVAYGQCYSLEYVFIPESLKHADALPFEHLVFYAEDGKTVIDDPMKMKNKDFKLIDGKLVLAPKVNHFCDDTDVMVVYQPGEIKAVVVR